jgi:MFS family permease
MNVRHGEDLHGGDRPKGVRGHVLLPFSSLRYPAYRALWAGQFGQAGAMWLEMVARNWIMWDMTHQGLMLAMLNLARAGPGLGFGLIAGVVADRVNKKRVLQIAQVATLASHLIMVLLLATGNLEIWHLFASSFVNGVANAFNQPTRQSMIAQVVPRESLLNAVSLNQIAVNTSRILGPSLSGVLIAVSGATSAYIAASTTYLIVIAATVFLPALQPVANARRLSMAGSLKEGLGFAFRTAPVRDVLLLMLGFYIFAMPYTSLMPIIADEVLGIGAGGYGLLLSLAGAGALLGGFVNASVRGAGSPMRIVRTAALAFSGLLIALAFTPWVALAMVLMLGLGAASTTFMAWSNSTVLALTPQEMQGRVMSVNAMDRGLVPLGTAMGGLLRDFFSASVALSSLGVLCGGVVLALSAASRKVAHSRKVQEVAG